LARAIDLQIVRAEIVRIAPQQHTEIIEPGDDALLLDAIDEKHRHRGFVLADMVQEHILNILIFFGRHV